MSFQINGTTWTPNTASEHTTSIMETINQLLEENGITDKNGDIVQLKQNYGNALYLLSLAVADRIADNDSKLSAAINSFNISLCDETQIENLLPIASVNRNPGSYSTLVLTVTASESGDCSIPAGTKAPFGSVNFVTKTDVLVSAGSSQNIDTVCDTIGAIAVLTGEITKFDTQIANLASVTNGTSSVPGTNAETTSALRQRLVQGNTIKYTLDGCKTALEELTGINYAKIFFNYNTDESTTLQGGVELAPRHAYIIIDGESDQLAETYAEYMSAPTQNGNVEASAHSQDYVTGSGQSIPIYYDTASEQNVYVKIYLEADAESGTQVDNQLARDLITASASWGIGKDVNSMLVTKPFTEITYTSVAYCLVSLDGETWSNSVEIPCNTIPRVTDTTIEVESLE